MLTPGSWLVRLLRKNIACLFLNVNKVKQMFKVFSLPCYSC